MGHRINERNTGGWSLDGEPKTRRSKKRQPLTPPEKRLLKAVLSKVIDCMEFDPDLSDHGHLHPDAKFSDGGRFLLSMNRTTFEGLCDAFAKLDDVWSDEG